MPSQCRKTQINLELLSSSHLWTTSTIHILENAIPREVLSLYLRSGFSSTAYTTMEYNKKPVIKIPSDEASSFFPSFVYVTYFHVKLLNIPFSRTQTPCTYINKIWISLSS